jgi:hypothetical protein
LGAVNDTWADPEAPADDEGVVEAADGDTVVGVTEVNDPPAPELHPTTVGPNIPATTTHMEPRFI